MNVTPPAVFSAGGVTFKMLVIASQFENWRGNPFSQTLGIRIPAAATSVTASE